MLQVKFLTADSTHTLEEAVNRFLASIGAAEVKDIKYQHPALVIVQYEVKEEWMSNICADCKYWDDSGSSDAVIGICQEHGYRKRFSCNACNKFKDIRR